MKFPLHIDIICHTVKGSKARLTPLDIRDVEDCQLTTHVVQRQFFIEDLRGEILRGGQQDELISM